MMTLKEQINKDFMEAFKTKNMDKKNFLGVVKGDVTDDTVMTIIKKMEKSLKQTNTDESMKELEYIKPYLPTLMGEDRIREILTTYKVNGIDNIGKMMGEFNKNFKGMADNGLVSKIVKEVLI